MKRESDLTQREAAGNLIHEFEATLKNKESELKSREEKLAALENSANEREKALSEHSQATNEREAEIEKREVELTAREQELADKIKTFEASTNSLKQREAAIVNSEAEALRKSAEAREFEELLKEIPAFDPNNSTEAALILTFPISAAARRDLIAQQRAAYTKYNNGRITQAFEDYVKAAESQPDVNYLSAFWAAQAASRLRNRTDDAMKWLDKALEINPSYRPAQELKRKLEASRAPARRRSK